MNTMKPRTNYQRLTLLFFLLGIILSLVGVTQLRILAQQTTTISIAPTKGRGNVNPLVFGANHRYAYSGFSMWNAQNSSTYPAFATAFRNTGFTVVRFPGGTIANTYHWKRAIGPLAQRTRNIHGKTMEPLTNEFGSDEFVRFIQQNGATGTVVVNIATGTAQEAADWVEYMNAPVGTNPGGGIAWAKVRQTNGRATPYPITYWEVGNEDNNPNLQYWRGALSNQKYVFGGKTSFVKQRVGKLDDHRNSAAVSNGKPSQVFYVKYPPIQLNSQTVYVNGQAWTASSNLSQVGKLNVYQINFQTGKIQFGDGIHGNIPPSGSVVTIDYISDPHDGFVDFYRAMKAIDPSIKVCPSYDVSLHLGAKYPFDCMVIHPYTSTTFATGNTAALFHDNVMLGPAKRAEDIKLLRQTLRNNVGTRADNIDVVVSEYGINNRQPESRPSGTMRYELSLGGALYTAVSLKHWLDLGIPIAQKHSLIDFVFGDAPPGSTSLGSQFNGMFSESPAFVSSATALVFKLYKPMSGSQLIQSSVTNNPVRVLSNGERLSALQTVTTMDSTGTIYLIVINCDRITNVTASVALQRYRSNQIANIKTLNGASYLSYNTPSNPHTVDVVEQNRSIAPSQFTHTFPAHSVTAIKISGAVELL